MDKNSPIGVFDSGIGGLTVADAIHRIMPKESLIYFGDTAHLPYGDKAPSSIKKYSISISDFLLEQGCKMIVIACNTASAIAYDEVRKHVDNRAIVIDVINPVANAVGASKTAHNVGVIGTRATIRSKVYVNRLKAVNPGLKVSAQATPLLAPMIEEGFFNNKISSTIINNYLSQPKIRNIDTLILACTHYPLIKPEIVKYYVNHVKIIDSAEIVARYIQKQLGKKKLLSTNSAATHKFFISDYTKSFEQSAGFFFKEKLKLKELNLWAVSKK